jgi:D-alanyl-lipoteichoic acid acyltransferase DltB (MBOAT superfamily)
MGGTYTGGTTLPEVSLSSVRKVLGWFTTFHMTVLAWVLFRSNSFGDAALLIESAITGTSSFSELVGVVDFYTLSVSALAIATVVAVEWLSRGKEFGDWISVSSFAVGWMV